MTTLGECTCGCGFRLQAGMTVLWLLGKPYAARCITMGPLERPEAALSLSFR